MTTVQKKKKEKLDSLFFIPLLTLTLPPILSPWNKPSGTGGSSQERELTGFVITPSVIGELVGCLAQLEHSDPLALSVWIPKSSPLGILSAGKKTSAVSQSYNVVQV